jgi:hypothetical protein
MADDSVSIPVIADTAPAQKALDSFAKETDKTLKSIEKSVGNFGDSFKSAAIKIGAAVASFAAIKKAVGEAVSEENAIRSLNLALAGTGEYSAEAAASMQEFAESLGDVTGLGDDAVRSALTLAKSFGITNDQAKQLVDAAADLSAVTGDDLDTAVRQLAGTFDGTIGKIGNLGADFRNLTADQLKNGDAIKLLNQRYGDAAESLGETFGASLSRLQNAFDDSFKEIGKSIIQDANIKQGLNAFAQGLKDLAPAISVFANIAVKTFALVAEGVAKLAKTVTFAGAALAETFGADDIAGNLYKATASLDDFSQGLEDSRKGIAKIDEDSKKFNTTLEKISTSAVKTGELTGKALEETKKKAKELADEGAKFKEGIFSGFGDAAETEAAKAQQALLKSFELEKKGALTSEEAYNIRLRIATDFNAKRVADAEKSAKEEADKVEKTAAEARSRIEKAAQQPIKFAIDEKGALSSKEIGASVVGGIGSALKGRSGALDLVSQTFAGIGDAILPGIGGAVGGIAQLLAQGPEATKKFIKEFIASIPDIIEAIAESIPVVVEVFVDTMVNRGGAVRIGIAIAKAMAGQAIWAAIGQQVFGKSGEEMRKSIVSGASEFATETKSGFQQFTTEFFPQLSRTFKGLGSDIEGGYRVFTDTFLPSIKNYFTQFGTDISNFLRGIGNALNVFIFDMPKAIFEGLLSFINAIVAPIEQAFKPLNQSVGNLDNSIKKLYDPIERLIRALGGKGGGKGIIAETAEDMFSGGTAEQIYKAILNPVGTIANAPVIKALGKAGVKFSKGGIVPMYAADGAFVPKGTDTVPAMLTPGELVVPRDMVGELGAFLSAQNNTGGDGQAAMLAAILSAVQAPIVVKTEAKVNQNAFADIILQLNRQNARLAV